MELTQKQALMLIEVLSESLNVQMRGCRYNHHERKELYDEIVKQQSNIKVELSK